MSDFDLMISIAKRLNDDRSSLQAEVERLRGALGLRDALRHAAEQDEIERQRREIKNLREAIQSLAERLEVDPSGTDKITDLEADNERLRAEMLDLAEWCETEEPLSYKQMSHRLRAALGDKP